MWTKQIGARTVASCRDVTGDCLEGATLVGIVHAVDAGADVINMSLGGFGGQVARNASPGLVAAITRTLNYARQQGVTVVTAAGNAALDLDHNGGLYAAYCDAPHVICVSATGPTQGGIFGPWTDPDAFAFYSNFGSSVVDVAAPGGNGTPPATLGGLVWGACSTTAILPSRVRCQSTPSALGLIGTSMATPHVTGLVALLVEDLGRSPARIRAAVRQGADDLGRRGSDPLYGSGRLNVARALGLD